MFPAESHKGGTRLCPEYLPLLCIDTVDMLSILLQSLGEEQWLISTSNIFIVTGFLMWLKLLINESDDLQTTH